MALVLPNGTVHGRRYVLDDSDGLTLVEIIEELGDQYHRGQLERGKAAELFRRELRLFVPAPG